MGSAPAGYSALRRKPATQGFAMSLDISSVLENWPFRHEEVVARRVLGDDGKEKVQLRLDLGLLQMDADGRPDGRRPYGQESYLEFHLNRLKVHGQRQGADHRYVALSALNDYERLVRDTDRNLRLLDLVWSHAPADERASLEQFRPYLVMMNTRGRVLMSLDAKDITAALLQIRTGIRLLEEFFRKHDHESAIAECQEILALRKWGLEIMEKRPPTLQERLQKELAEAVRNEDYERAARLRDEIRTWEEKGQP
jgi:hypothetical protein